MKKLFCLLTLAFPLFLSAQTILMEEDIAGDTVPEVFGPNLKHFTHTYFSYGLAVGSASNNIILGKSYEFVSGLRYKNKISNHYSWGFNLAYTFQNIRMKPTTKAGVMPDREKITFNNIDVELYNRINFGKRGNVIGKYIDIGFYGTYIVGSKYYYRIKQSSTSFSQYNEYTHKGLNDLRKLVYGPSVRLGWDWIALYAKYRIPTIFISSSNFGTAGSLLPEPPQYMVGIELSIQN